MPLTWQNSWEHPRLAFSNPLRLTFRDRVLVIRTGTLSWPGSGVIITYRIPQTLGAADKYMELHKRGTS